ncbi:hypothetical protein QQF64_023217 [Cirrhinus molitorella]|uniref:Uncharacterized protein n=1 Tax=Cirrhinus molitorella TaxID=172907 RepID=A0ABR3L759_9TELE
MNIPAAGPERSWVTSRQPQKNTEKKRQKQDNGEEWRPIQQREWCSENTPQPRTVTSSSLCLWLSKGPEGSTPELKHHCLPRK